MTSQILVGDAFETLRTLESDSVQCCMTSPPYWGLRSYLPDEHPDKGSELGLESTPEEHVAAMVAVFEEVRRVLRPDGVLFLNYGDGYAQQTIRHRRHEMEWDDGRRKGAFGQSADGLIDDSYSTAVSGLKPKDLVGMPWRIAFALQAAGWWLRSDIIWHKPNPMPESVTDRPSKSHEYVFLLTKSAKYFYDADAVREAGRYGYSVKPFMYDRIGDGETPATRTTGKTSGGRDGDGGFRNLRSVWTIPTQAFNGSKLLADYVGLDGKPYKASPDCPTHGHLATRQRQQKPECDARQDSIVIHTHGTYDDLGQERVSEYDATPETTSCNPASGTGASYTPKSTPCNKTSSDPQSCVADLACDGKTPCHNCCSDSPGAPVGDSSDCPSQLCVEIATSHSTQTRKKDRAPVTIPPCIACAQTNNRTDGKQASPETIEHTCRTHESNTLPDVVGDLPSEQTLSRTVNKSSYIHDTVPDCTCQEISTDHFATFPEELAARCILAGTSEYGACAACGTPWERVTEPSTEYKRLLAKANSRGDWYPRQATNTTRDDGTKHGKLEGGIRPDYRTLGFRPTCACGTEERRPCVVLDPFCGSGTTGLVAARYGRSFVGIELNPGYADMARRRIAPALAQPALLEAG